MARIVELGCVACRKNGLLTPMTVEVHHLLNGGVRAGHHETVALCGWHHVGRTTGGFDGVKGMEMVFGPSLYHDARAFHARYGTDSELWDFQNSLLAGEEGNVA
jgi:hypothetical protein